MIEIFDRELSWLSFNHRVLQEAADKTVPLFERIKFLAIFSSNLDEFFRVRVASIRSLLYLKKKKRKKLDFNPEQLLVRIQKTIYKQQEEFGRIYREEIIPLMNANNIFILKDTEVPEEHSEFIREHFRAKMFPHILPVIIEQNNISLFLRNKAVYLAVRFQKSGTSEKRKRKRIALIEIPVEHCGRFLTLPSSGEKKLIMFADDMLRYCLNLVLPGYDILETYSIKLTRDAELYIDDEFSGDLREKIKSSLSKRTTGAPCRFLYDKTMPNDFLRYLKKTLKLQPDDLFPGGRYHNFNDMFSLPVFQGDVNCYESMPPLKCLDLENTKSLFSVIAKKDYLLHYPYHSYDYVINFLNEAANDPRVKSIKITLYRNANKSKVIKALISAARNGKKVTAFVEVKARFDEELNFQHAEEMEQAGIKVLYSFPGMKVHAKICLVGREEELGVKYYAYLATGNFNEKTALIYSDFGFFTSDASITSELRKIFDYLTKKSDKQEFHNLLAAPFNLRNNFTDMIRNEAQNASEGKKAYIILKHNSIEDPKIIRELYHAAAAGVKIYIVVRGICCLVPRHRNIKAISIVDRYLEHSRIYIFCNGGKEKIYLASADMMRRNLNRRIELCFPVNDKELRTVIKKIVKLHLSDSVKARIINSRQSNPYRKSRSLKQTRAQYATYEYLKSRED